MAGKVAHLPPTLEDHLIALLFLRAFSPSFTAIPL